MTKNDFTGKVTAEDLRNYDTEKREPLEGELSDMKMYLTPPPTSGAVLGLILNILKGGCLSCVHNYEVFSFIRLKVGVRTFMQSKLLTKSLCRAGSKFDFAVKCDNNRLILPKTKCRGFCSTVILVCIAMAYLVLYPI